MIKSHVLYRLSYELSPSFLPSLKAGRSPNPLYAHRKSQSATPIKSQLLYRLSYRLTLKARDARAGPGRLDPDALGEAGAPGQ